jgi:Tfp pilus assembly protein FimV
MKRSKLTLLAASLTLAFCGMASANDAPAKPPKPGTTEAHGAPDAHGEADAHGGGHDKPAEPPKSDKPAEKELPSKPYPKNPVPAKLTPTVEKSVGMPDKALAVAPKPEAAKPKEEKVADAIFDKPAPVKKHKPVVHADAGHEHAATDPALKQLVSDTVNADAHGQSADREPYRVQAKDNLDRVIKKTLPTTPFSNEILREAFIKANPQAFPEGRQQRLRAGQTLRIPDAAMLRLVVLGEVGGKADSHDEESHGASHEAPKAAPATAAPAVDTVPPLSVPRQPVAVASANMPAPAVSPEEKKKWIRFP